MADGALERFGADVAVSITGIAGPAAAREEKPVGTCAGAPSSPTARELARDVRLPGDRAEIRDRSTTVGMHLLRRAAARGGRFPGC